MPPRRKIDLLPGEFRHWLQDELKECGFSDYEGVAERLNFRLEKEGVSLRVHRASVQRFGQEYREFVKYQEEAGAWAADWITDQGLDDEANRHGVLFQMLTTLAFKFMKDQMVEGQEVDPKELHFIGRMMKDIMASSGLRENMLKAERNAQSEKLDQAVAKGEIDRTAAAKAREIMGFG